MTIAAVGRLRTVGSMNQPPRTTTRRPTTTRRIARQLDVVIRADALETPAALVTPPEAVLIWEEIGVLTLANPQLEGLAAKARELATTGQLADNSVSTYAGLWRIFDRWCAGLGLPSLPASTATVLLYVAHRAGQGVKPDTVRMDLSAIRSYHLHAGFTNPTDHAVVSQARKAVGRQSADGGTKKTKAHPLALDEVRTMAGCLDQLRFNPAVVAGLRRIRLKAVLCVGWFAGRRTDELARAELPWLITRDGVLHLESSHQKNRPGGLSTSIDKIVDDEVCPWTALRAWLEVSAPIRGDVQRLFAMPAIDDAGAIVLIDTIEMAYQQKVAQGWTEDDPRYPTRESFEAKCRAVGVAFATRELRNSLTRWMKLAAVQPQSPDRALRGHSMRRGLITTLRAAGVDPRAVADHVGLATIGMVEEYNDAASKVNVLDVLNL